MFTGSILTSNRKLIMPQSQRKAYKCGDLPQLSDLKIHGNNNTVTIQSPDALTSVGQSVFVTDKSIIRAKESLIQKYQYQELLTLRRIVREQGRMIILYQKQLTMLLNEKYNL